MNDERVRYPHPEGWARRGTTLKRTPPVLQHSAVPSPRFSVGIWVSALMLLLSAYPAICLSAQTVDHLAVRLAGMTAVTGLEQAMTDSLLALLPGSARDRAGNVTLTLGRAAPKRLVSCPLDAAGDPAANVTAEGYLLLRRVGGRTQYPLCD